VSEGELPLPDAAATAAIGHALGTLLGAGDVVALFGDLGAGKTSLARGALAALGLAEEAPSPTFAIVQPYAPPEVVLPVAHVDLYRLSAPEDAEELGLEEWLEDGALLIEWPERLGDALWGQALRLTLAPEAAGGRRLTWAAPAAWEARWPPHLPKRLADSAR
jgi:tRNA threonylcarbamoyladenosine biosynthesis protein TsaE